MTVLEQAEARKHTDPVARALCDLIGTVRTYARVAKVSKNNEVAEVCDSLLEKAEAK